MNSVNTWLLLRNFFKENHLLVAQQQNQLKFNCCPGGPFLCFVIVGDLDTTFSWRVSHSQTPARAQPFQSPRHPGFLSGEMCVSSSSCHPPLAGGPSERPPSESSSPQRGATGAGQLDWEMPVQFPLRVYNPPVCFLSHFPFLVLNASECWNSQ